jgi:hypothetical protein
MPAKRHRRGLILKRLHVDAAAFSLPVSSNLYVYPLCVMMAQADWHDAIYVLLADEI